MKRFYAYFSSYAGLSRLPGLKRLRESCTRTNFWKGIVSFLILLLAGFAFASPAYALAPSADTNRFINDVDKCIIADCSNKAWYTTDSIFGIMNVFIGGVGGGSKLAASPFYNEKSAVAQLSNIVLAMYSTPPADLALWFQDTGRSLGFLPQKVEAQGIGFTGLSPLLPIWRAFRNISYALLALVMVIIGFMVMFRRKIDPKTVVTVQNALPKIVLALLLITFSYAIAAFFIDLMYLVMAIIINLIVSNSGGALGADTAQKYISGGLGTVAGALFGGGWSSIDDLIKLLMFYDSPAGSAPWFATWIPTVLTLGLYPAAVSIIVTFIVAIAILFGLIRIVFMLITAYIQVIVAVLIAPFQLMTEALPGSTSFNSWARNLFASLSVFPVTAAMLLVGTMLTRENAGHIWTPPLLSGTLGAGANGVSGLIGLGFLLTIPNIANAIKEALKAKAPIEAGLGAILGPLGTGVGQAFQYGYQGSFVASTFLHKPQPSTPLQRQTAAGKSGVGGVLGGEGK